MSVFKSYWFWLLVVGLLIVILAALFTSGFQQDNGWVWWIFALGIVLIVLGIIFGLATWYGNKKECSLHNENMDNNLDNLDGKIDNSKSKVVTPATPLPMPSAPSSPVTSPLKSPTRVTINMPQVQKGFLSTTDNLATLAPSP